MLSIKSICPFSIIYDMQLYTRHNTNHNVIATYMVAVCSKCSTKHERGINLKFLSGTFLYFTERLFYYLCFSYNMSGVNM